MAAAAAAHAQLLRLRGGGSPAAWTARRRPAPFAVAALLRPAPTSLPAGPSLLLRLRLGGGLLPAGLATKPLPAMCIKSRCTSSTPVDQATAPDEHTQEDQITTVVAATEEGVAPQHKSAIIHDFCLGIPFGGLLFSMGLVGFLFWRSPASLTFGVAPGLAILALAVLSLKGWRSGKSSLPFILAQGAVAGAVAWKHCQAYATTKKLLPWGFYAALSAAMICFYSYVLLAGGNPPPKKKKAAAAPAPAL